MVPGSVKVYWHLMLLFEMRRLIMLFLSTRTRLLLLMTYTLFASLILALIPVAAAHAATGFTTQARLGFPAGDDWEPALAADRYGHVYVLYKHYDVAGQTSCSSCALHVLLQVSSDRGQTWSAPSPIDPEPVVGGQYDSQIAVDPVDGKTVWATFLQNKSMPRSHMTVGRRGRRN